MKAALRVSTSDVGTSGANLYPMLLCGPKQNTIALGDPLRLSHENGVTLEQFDKQLGLLFGKYQAALKNLTRLLGILITNPGNSYDWDYEKGEGSETIYHGSREFVYTPLINENDYISEESESFLNKFYNGTINSMVMNFIENDKLSHDDIEELKKFLIITI